MSVRRRRRWLRCIYRIERLEVALKKAGAFEAWSLQPWYMSPIAFDPKDYLIPRYSELTIPWGKVTE